jgi:hypothetical protein
MTVEERDAAMAYLGINPGNPTWPLPKEVPAATATGAAAFLRAEMQVQASPRGRGRFARSVWGSRGRGGRKGVTAKRQAESVLAGEATAKRQETAQGGGKRFASVESASEEDESSGVDQ